MLRFFILFTTAFPTLMVVITVNSSLAIYSLHNFSLNAVKKNSIYHQRFIHDFKRFFSFKRLAVILLSVLILEAIAFVQPNDYGVSTGTPAKDFSVGVTFCGNTTAEAKSLIDQVKNYTNVFVIDSLPISQNEAELNTICNYAVQCGLHIIVYFAWFSQYWQANWLDTAEQRWGGKFLGVYLYDEPGGIQLDNNGSKYGTTGPVPTNQIQAANRYLQSFQTANRGESDMQMLKIRNIKAFTSDYALYWFDYETGYDTVFTQFGWNNSRQMDISLCRGAATIQGKDWGVMITWTYDQPPYLESSTQLLSDMKLAYDNGAKYIIVFNSDGQGGGILGTDQLNAMQQFWQYAKANPAANSAPDDRAAYVLPDAYGYGFRGLNDSIWGFWPADNFADQQYTNINNAMQQYGNKLDVIYDDPSFPNYTSIYSKLIFWNGTIL